MIFHDEFCKRYCKSCGKEYANDIGWCKPCQIDDLKGNFTTSGNEKIDNFIQEIQLKIDNWEDTFEWIPYDQFSDIKEIGRSATVYSAIWKDGSLQYEYKGKYIRKPHYTNYKVALKCLQNSQNITNEFLNEV